MGVIDSLKETSSKAIDTGETFLHKTREYYTLKAFQQLAISVSLLSKILLIGSILFLAAIFIVVAATIALGEYIDNIPMACLIIATCLIFLAGIVYYFRAKIDSGVVRKLSKEFFT